MSQALSTRGWPVAPIAKGASYYRRLALAEREALLRNASLFSGLPKRHLRSIAKVTSISNHRSGTPIVEAGASGSTFYALVDGGAKVVRGGRTLRRLGPGDFFGEIALLDPGPRTASVIADTDTRCLSLSSKDFLDVVTGEPVLAAKVLRVLARRIREAEPSQVA